MFDRVGFVERDTDALRFPCGLMGWTNLQVTIKWKSIYSERQTLPVSLLGPCKEQPQIMPLNWEWCLWYCLQEFLLWRLPFLSPYRWRSYWSTTTTNAVAEERKFRTGQVHFQRLEGYTSWGEKTQESRPDKVPLERTLGLYWDTETDTLAVKVSLSHRKANSPTRRLCLSKLSSTFHRPSLICPILLPLRDWCKRSGDWSLTGMISFMRACWKGGKGGKRIHLCYI